MTLHFSRFGRTVNGLEVSQLRISTGFLSAVFQSLPAVASSVGAVAARTEAGAGNGRRSLLERVPERHCGTRAAA